MPHIKSPSPDTDPRLSDPFAIVTTQHERLLRFSSTLGDDRLLAHRFHGHETLGRVPRWTVDLISHSADIDEHQLIGRPVSLAIRLEDGTDAFRHGLGQSLDYLGSDGGLHDWQLTFVPWFALLGYRTNCRIWMDVSIIDVFGEILDSYSETSGNYRFDLSHDYTPRSYVSQINESDENFIQRWCEHLGIFWYCKHRHDQHTLVFTDDIYNLPEASRATIRFHTQAATQREDSIVQWRQQRRLHSSAIQHASRSYRAHQQPRFVNQMALEGSTTLPALEHYRYQGQYAWRASAWNNRNLPPSGCSP